MKQTTLKHIYMSLTLCYCRYSTSFGWCVCKPMTSDCWKIQLFFLMYPPMEIKLHCLTQNWKKNHFWCQYHCLKKMFGFFHNTNDSYVLYIIFSFVYIHTFTVYCYFNYFDLQHNNENIHNMTIIITIKKHKSKKQARKNVWNFFFFRLH